VKYVFAWMLGVPGGLIVLWFIFNHLHWEIAAPRGPSDRWGPRWCTPLPKNFLPL